MTSEVAICNLALSNIGKQNIQSLSEPTAEARACNQFYEHSRDALLQGFPWFFAGTTAPVASVVNSKQGLWGFAYRRPVDCLKIHAVSPRPAGPIATDIVRACGQLGHPFDFEDTTVYCNLSPAWLVYTRRVVDPMRFPPLFVEALSWALATRLAMPLTRDLKTRTNCYQLAETLRKQAEMMDANEVRETSDISSDFVKARG